MQDSSPEQDHQTDECPEENRAASDQCECHAGCRRVAESVQNNAVAAFIDTDRAGNETKCEIDDFGE